MALFKVFRGDSSRLNSVELHDGYAYFTPDDGAFYIDSMVDGELKRIRVNQTYTAGDNVEISDDNVISVGSGLPDASQFENGTAMVAVDGEWQMQKGYGYRTPMSSITWDGDITGRDSCMIGDYTLYKVDNQVFDAGSLRTAMYSFDTDNHDLSDIERNNMKIELSQTISRYAEDLGGAACGYIYIVSGDAGTYTSNRLGIEITMPSSGTYFLKQDGGFVSSFVPSVDSMTHKFDIDYIPNKKYQLIAIDDNGSTETSHRFIVNHTVDEVLEAYDLGYDVEFLFEGMPLPLIYVVSGEAYFSGVLGGAFCSGAMNGNELTIEFESSPVPYPDTNEDGDIENGQAPVWVDNSLENQHGYGYKSSEFDESYFFPSTLRPIIGDWRLFGYENAIDPAFMDSAYIETNDAYKIRFSLQSVSPFVNGSDEVPGVYLMTFVDDDPSSHDGIVLPSTITLLNVIEETVIDGETFPAKIFIDNSIIDSNFPPIVIKSEVFHKFDPRYLPDNNFVVNIRASSSGIVADKTNAAIFEAYRSGQNVTVLLDGVYIGQPAYIMSDHAVFIVQLGDLYLAVSISEDVVNYEEIASMPYSEGEDGQVFTMVDGEPGWADPQSVTETDPVFTASAAASITSSNINDWNNKGTYSKPLGGIPKTDLESAVQTSLGKADSALQSVPSTYRTAAAQDVIDAGKQPVISDLETIRSGAAAGETALQPGDLSDWAKATNKPSYTASEVGARSSSWTPTKSQVGLGNVDNVRQYSESNPPPYPVTSVNGQTGDVTISGIPDGGNVNDVLTKLADGIGWQALSGAKITYGKYTGTGTGGSSSKKKSVSPGFTPVALLIGPAQPNSTNYAPCILIRDKPNYSAPMTGSNANSGGTVVWASNKVSWYSEGVMDHLNYNGWVYYWVAIGY